VQRQHVPKRRERRLGAVEERADRARTVSDVLQIVASTATAPSP